jgi:hypothetical protein
MTLSEAEERMQLRAPGDLGAVMNARTGGVYIGFAFLPRRLWEGHRPPKRHCRKGWRNRSRG